MDEFREPTFSINEFRSWLSKQNDLDKGNRKKKAPEINESFVGKEVEPRLGIHRLVEKIAEYNQNVDAEELANQFKSAGGTILGVTDLLVTVETTAGTFALPKFYMRNKEG